jgi:hypothetical protein
MSEGIGKEIENENNLAGNRYGGSPLDEFGREAYREG